MTSRKIEMTWRCSACGERNLGRRTTCQRCGDPKDRGEPYEMPADTAAAASVTDPALLRLANAGANWRCAYCGSDQRRLDGACRQCGASPQTGRSVAGAATAPPAPRRPTGRGSGRSTWLALGGCGALALVCLFAGGLWAMLSPRPAPSWSEPPVAAPPPPRRVQGTVVGVAWTHTVHVERRRLVAEEGFADARPADALEVTAAGEHVHHHDRVQDGYETEQYSEQVPYDELERYSERVQCGQDCTDLPQTCTETCRPDDNGFATCTTSCTGGGQSCSPRYCDEPRTRTVTRYRSETRTRQVPRYRDEPRTAPWFRWRVWRWTPERHVVRRGTTDEPAWPTDAELAPEGTLAAGEQERTSRSSRYVVSLGYEGDRVHEETVASPEALRRFAPGSRWWLEVAPYGGSRLLGPVEEPDAGGGGPAAGAAAGGDADAG